MILHSIKTRFYQRMVEKDPRVQSHYEGYVDCNRTYHAEHRRESWDFLRALRRYYKNNEQGVFPQAPRSYKPKATAENAPAPDKAPPASKPQPKNPAPAAPKPAPAKPPQPPAKPKPPRNNGPVFPESKALQRQEIDALVSELEQFDVVSFDIFDTLVLRPFEQPKDLFHLMGAEMKIPTFRELRTKTEMEARDRTLNPNREVTISDIYDLLAVKCGIDKEIWMAREIELELELCFANPYMQQVYRRLKEQGKKVVATSDMYLPKRIMEKLLANCGYTDLDEIFVSCDFNQIKKNGGLQDLVRKKMGRWKKIIHVGDNFESDVKATRRMKMNAIYYPSVTKLGKSYLPPNLGLAGSIARGVINSTIHSGNHPLNPYYEYGFIVGGILVCGYCEWLNKLAKRRGVDKFLFTARDGNIISKVYNRFYREVDNDYVLASRFSLFQATFDRFCDRFITGIIDRRATFTTKKKTMEEVFRESDLAFLIEEFENWDIDPQEPFTEEQCPKIHDFIYEHKLSILRSFQRNQDAAAAYFLPFVEGYQHVCIVDVGWNGSCVGMLQHLLESRMPSLTTCGALIGTNMLDEIALDTSTGNIEAYLFSRYQNADMLREHRPAIHNLLVEFLFSATHPSLLKYDFDEHGELQFLFREINEHNYAVTRQLQQGVLDFAEKYNRITKSHKDFITITPYDAFGPFRVVHNQHPYSYELFHDYQEESLAGIFTEEQSMMTFGEIMKERHCI